jgi:hypothetical protein
VISLFVTGLLLCFICFIVSYRIIKIVFRVHGVNYPFAGTPEANNITIMMTSLCVQYYHLDISLDVSFFKITHFMKYSPYSEANNNIFANGTQVHNTSYEPYITQIVANVHSNNFSLYLHFKLYTHRCIDLPRSVTPSKLPVKNVYKLFMPSI